MRSLLSYPLMISLLVLSTDGSLNATTPGAYRSGELTFSYPAGWRVTQSTRTTKGISATVIRVHGPQQAFCNITFYRGLLDAKKQTIAFVESFRKGGAGRISGVITRKASGQRLAGVAAHGYWLSFSINNVKHRALYLIAADKRTSIGFLEQVAVDSMSHGCTLVRTTLRRQVAPPGPRAPGKPTPGPTPKKRPAKE